jgi:hypothetical protein
MIDIHIRDGNFFSDKKPVRANPLFNWIWDRSPIDSDITVFSDSFIREVETSQSKIKIAWLIEPPVIDSFIYEYIKENYNLFDMVMTFDESLLSLSPKFRYYPYGTTWIENKDRKVWDKTESISAVFSNKKLSKGHAIRHSIYSGYKDQVTFFGDIDSNYIMNKIDGHKDYRFSLIVENWDGNSYFSEKLLDCLLTGTIPVYWGFPNYANFFDPNGFIYFTEFTQLSEIIPHLTPEQYESRRDAILYNFEKAKECMDLDKNLWYYCLKDFLENRGQHV